MHLEFFTLLVRFEWLPHCVTCEQKSVSFQLFGVAALFLVAAASAKSLPENEESDIDEFGAFSVRHRAERSPNGSTRNNNVRTTSNTASVSNLFIT